MTATATEVPGARGPLARRGVGRTRLLVFVAIALGIAAGRIITYDRSSDARSGARSGGDSPAARVERLEEVVRQNPRDVAQLQALGGAYVQSVAAGGDVALYNDAEAVFERAEELAPGDPRTTVTQGYLALARHDFSRARDLGIEAVTADPFDADALAVTVDAEVELGIYDDAAQHLQQLLDVRPGLAAYSRLSYLRELHGDVLGARQAFAQAEAAGSSRYDLASIAVLRGKLALNQGDLDEADAHFDRARGYVGEPAGAEAGEARLLAARGDRTGAIAILETAIAERPTAEVAILLGDLLGLEGRTAAAARADAVVRDLATEESAAGADVSMELSLFEADRGNPAPALELAESAYAVKPDNVTANITMAWALRVNGRAPEALGFVDRALRLGTPDALLHFRAAAVLADAGQTDRAAAELQAAFSISPWFSFGHLEEADALAARLGIDVSTVERS
ncbi:MAG: tetratricopeptide repeat protein [Acidimicrobiia bacterium]